MFQVGDRVRYVNRTGSACVPAIGHIGTVLEVDTEKENLRVTFDEPCWNGRKDMFSTTKGFWKWELIESFTPQQMIIRKIKSLDERFKNKRLVKSKSTALPLPK